MIDLSTYTITPLDHELLKASGCSKQALNLFREFQTKGLSHDPVTSDAFEIQMYDIIGSETCNEQTFTDALAEAAGRPVTIRLSSPGGSVFTGVTLYNALKRYTGGSTVIVDGVCASIASVVALGAETVQTQPTALWMIHNAWLLTAGNASELRQSAEVLDKIDANLRSIYANKTGTSPESWGELMAAETWYTADEAVAIGLSDAMPDMPKKKKVMPPDCSNAIEPIVNSTDVLIQREIRIRRALMAARR